ncbi:nuclear transport factor 2 family protein [Draconibacterium sp. IB214405]|uniref:nuclear transport factor 2 family protein n=1 Tax=Draconibacterium sp. IB214405 TaxID=3097352 RepID=UPI002A0CA29B|nr:nuclear transport factor 2 family protein [Draconibacterium sp. IB214405]MDX8338869.1 nuclear transport factor 2 family protein [Draconibacterium sp. IB214405]
MKTISILLTAGLFMLAACTSTTEKALTQSERENIIAEVMAVSSKWIDDNNAMDPDRAIQFWSTSPDLKFAEFGEFFPNRDSIHSTLHSYYDYARSMDVKWLARDVRPLDKNVALLSGKFQFNLVFENDEVAEGINAFTGTFLKEDGKWRLIQGHESTKFPE